MKGIVFTEFLELVEQKFGLEVVDDIIEKSNLPSQGVYTSIGTYDFSEMLSLLTHLSESTKISIDDLLLVYAEHFFAVLATSYPGLIEQYNDPIEMLASIENHIHVEVIKIYPDAELPTFEILERTENSLIMIYKSSRAMHYFGLGLMNKTFEHFNSSAEIIMKKLKEDGTQVKFIITKN
ncbi:heme-NO-binding protein [Flavobacteriaceae bacterium MAR_2010_72]|nr:heme-NO-binding protein [Flavobacteriaceae bacterium MAR_2010_72]